MPRFFVRRDQVIENERKIYLVGEDAHHIARSLRMAVGDSVTVCDMQGVEYACVIESFDDDRKVTLSYTSYKRAENEPPVRIRLYQALPKGDKLDTIIQKAVECGVWEIVPFESAHCIAKVKPEAEDKKTERRRRIAAEAAKQCGRSVIPDVLPTVSFSEMLEGIKNNKCLFCYEGDGTEPLGAVLKRELGTGAYNNEVISVIIGSEGGFSISEAERIISVGATAVGLGKRILRTETASGFILACIVCFTELDGKTW
jgi:16S rRNA (uracil1498-N3)-methyltransferase